MKEAKLMKTRMVIQRLTAILVFLTGFIFALLGLFGITVTVNQADVNNIIFGLGTLISAAIEFGPMIFELVKDKQFREIMSIVNDVVWAVEGLEGLTSKEKKQKAMLSISKICEERGIKFEADKVDKMIESVVIVFNTVTK
jgi:uncharacterized membrane protein